MKLLVIGNEGRLEKYMPDTVNKNDFDITYVSISASDEEIIEKGKNAEIMLVDAMARVSADVIDALPELKMIHSEGVGFNYFDIERAREKGVYVCNCKAANAMAVAEQSVLLTMALLRHFNEGDKAFREGRQIQTKEEYMMNGTIKELGECTVGLLGFGDIAQAAAKLFNAFGAKVIYYNRTRKEKLEEKLNIQYVTKEELQKQSDIISVHLALNSETKHFVDEAFLMGMKKGSYIVNTARGDLVDTKALIKAIECEHIAGAGLDTVENEPVNLDNEIFSASEAVSAKCVFSPHIGGITGGAFRKCHKMFWDNVQKIINGERPERIVNGL